MNDYFNYANLLYGLEIFNDIKLEELPHLLKCLGCTKKHYHKDEIIVMLGEPISEAGIIVEGQVVISKDDVYGNQTIVTNLEKGQMFGEVFACARSNIAMVTVTSHTESDVIFLDINKIITLCSSSCSIHSKLVSNLLRIIADKSLYLNNRIDILSARSIREKVLTYIYYLYKSKGTNNLTIPFTRTELADFLGVNRSSLSRELCAMQDEGLINFDKNKFVLNFNK